MKRNQITIRAATSADANRIAKIRSDAIQNISHEYYNQNVLNEWAGPIEDRVQKLLSNSADIRIVAEIDNKILGYGELVTTENLLGACYISSKSRKQGIGKTIITELERIARAKGLNYLQMESSTNAEPFYIQCGYHVTERGKHTMQSGKVMDCVMMRKNLCK